MENVKVIDMRFLKNGNVNRIKHLKVRNNAVFSGDFPICIKLTDGMVWNVDYPYSLYRNNLRKKTELYNRNNIVRDKIEVAIALGYAGSRVLESDGKENGIIFTHSKKMLRYIKAHVYSRKDVVIEEL